MNAKQVINNHISKEDKYTFALNELTNYLGMKEINKLEGFDISHSSGENAVGSCVVFSKNGPSRMLIDYLIFLMNYLAMTLDH